jgi:hypothetical protein
MAGRLRKDAIRQAVHIASASEQNGRPIAGLKDIAVAVEAALGFGVNNLRIVVAHQAGELVGKVASPNDDPLVAIRALDHEVAE